MKSKLHIYNTLGRKTQEFKPVESSSKKDKNEVRMYCCGPTVYWYQHIGNLRTYVSEDILKRVLIYDGFKVKHVINITDVGHLTSDADEGEDKLVKALKREGLPLTKESMLKLADKYANVFKDDLKKLNISSPDVWAKATEHVSEMIKIVEKLQKNGYTYESGGNVYYDTSKFKDYTKLGNLNMCELKEGARTGIDENKKNPTDFVVWFTERGSKFKDHLMKWSSPWGTGWPGWHLECSAMSTKYLGEQFDIHCGGKEHIQVHHTNEIAQTEGATGKHPWVRYWVHTEWLVAKEGKMSKSKGSFYTLSDLEKEGYSPLDYRYFCLGANYRSPLTFSFEALDAAKNAFENLKKKIIEIKKDFKVGGKESAEGHICKFEEAINNDLNIPAAVGIMWEMIKDDKISNKEKYNALLKFDKIFGLDLDKVEEVKINVPLEIKKLAEERILAKKNKDFKKSDEIRDKIESKGFLIQDNKDGTFEIKKK